MDYVLHPWQFWLIGLAGWINRSQQEAIEYLRTETQILREVFSKKRILLNDDQRRRLAVKENVLGLHRLPYGPERLTLRMTLVEEQDLGTKFFDHESHHGSDRVVEEE